MLADYVLALLTTDESDAIARSNCVDNLKDFLNDKTDAFVSELFAAIATRSFDPSTKQPPPPPKPPAKATIPQTPAFNQGKKRGYHAPDRVDESRLPGNGTNGRPSKQARRGAMGGRHGRGNYLRPAISPPPLSGLPAWDPANPMASFMAMATAMATGLLPPGMPAMPMLPSTPLKSGNRCRDYDTKGFCTRGAQCPYDHGTDAYVVPQDDQMVEYDEESELLAGLVPTKNGMLAYSPLDWAGQNKQKSAASKKSRGRARKRADFSLQGPNHDQSVTSIVVEQIPKEKFDEQTVRDFFGEFGVIEDVTMMPHKRLAIIRYDSFRSASAAYNSPKSIFDNRFVKVYWYDSPDCLPELPMTGLTDDMEMGDEEPAFDIEEVRTRQDEAQRRYEERQKVLEEARQKRLEIDAKIRELEAKKGQVADELARKQGLPAESEKTRQLREQLAKLEEEAKTLGIDPDAVTIGSADWSSASFYPRGRGGYRGRGRGRGGYRGGYRGSGWAGAAKSGAVLRLDNRPKTVSVAFTEGSFDDHHEVLRSWLLFNAAEHASLDRHPDKPQAALITFEERYQCEIFMSTTLTTDFPLHGRIELSWYTGPPVTHGLLPDTTKAEDASSSVSSSSVSEADDRVDYLHDVANDDERWG